MTPGPSCTVIVPAYNASQTIGRTLTSIREAVAFARNKGKAGECEILVVDDRSTDDSVPVAQAYDSSDCPIRILRHAENLGAGCARNTGASQAKGDILFFLDADDLYLPSHIAVCVEAFRQKSHIDFVCTRFGTSRPVHPSWIAAISGAAVGPFAIRRDAHKRM